MTQSEQFQVTHTKQVQYGYKWCKKNSMESWKKFHDFTIEFRQYLLWLKKIYSTSALHFKREKSTLKKKNMLPGRTQSIIPQSQLTSHLILKVHKILTLDYVIRHIYHSHRITKSRYYLSVVKNFMRIQGTDRPHSLLGNVTYPTYHVSILSIDTDRKNSKTI